MNFQVVKTAILNVLGAGAAGAFNVIGYVKQGKDASEGKDNLVQVAFTDGDFPRNKSAGYGSCQHDIEFSIMITTSAATKADLSVLNDPNATALQLSTALLAAENAAYTADNKWDAVAAAIFNILKAGENMDLGLSIGEISDPWVSKIRKDDPRKMGRVVVLTGVVLYSCTVVEEPTGLTGTPGVSVSTTLDIDGDDIEQTEITVSP